MTQSAVPDPGGGEVSAGALAAVQRWQEFGALWRVSSPAGRAVTISLCRCDGGEEIDRLTSDDPDLLAWLDGRTSSKQTPGTRGT